LPDFGGDEWQSVELAKVERAARIGVTHRDACRGANAVVVGGVRAACGWRCAGQLHELRGGGEIVERRQRRRGQREDGAAAWRAGAARYAREAQINRIGIDADRGSRGGVFRDVDGHHLTGQQHRGVAGVGEIAKVGRSCQSLRVDAKEHNRITYEGYGYR